MDRRQIVYLEHESRVLAGNPLGDPAARSLPVYLPPSYHTDTSRRFPVIWVLAPFTSWGERFFNLQPWDENIVQRMDRLVREGKALPAILAFPDCFTRYGGSQYVNSTATGRYEDYLLEELIPFLDSQLRTLPGREHRGVLGYSSGGFGALWLALQHPEHFGAAASHSGDMAFEFCYWPDIPGAIRALEGAGGIPAFLESIGEGREKSRDWWSALNLIAMSACYSPSSANEYGFDLPFDLYTGEIRSEVWDRWLTFDPVRLAVGRIEALQSLRALYFDCGTRDEYNLFLGARRLHRLLEQYSVSHVYEEYEGGHFNVTWRYEVSLPLLTRALSPQGNWK